MSKIKSLLVGLGRIGCGYDAALTFEWDQPRSSLRTLTHARALACHPSFDLVAGVDPCPQARLNFSAIYRRPAFANLAEWYAAANGLEPELVVFAVPPQKQPSLVEELLRLTVPRLLLLEKPVAISLEQANMLKGTCVKHPDLIVAVNYIRRYLPAVGLWKRRLQKRQLGALLHGQITYGKGLMSNGSHFVNLAEAWLGPMYLKQILDAGHLCNEFDREAHILLHAADHGYATVLVRSVGEAGLRAGELDLWFESGRLNWQNNGNSVCFWCRCPTPIADSYESLSEEPIVFASGMGHYQLDVLDNLQLVLDNKVNEPACSLAAAVQTLKTLEPAIRN
jgi:predicted dehydrogenase